MLNNLFHSFQIRMLSRDIGVIGTYLIIASRSHEELSRRYRLAKLYPIGRSFLASYFIVLAFQLNQEVIEQKAFIHRVPGGLAVVSLFCIICLISSFMLMSEMKVKTTAQILLVLLLIIIVFVDLDFKYWQGKKVEYWNQITIVGNDVCMLAMLFMLAVWHWNMIYLPYATRLTTIVFTVHKYSQLKFVILHE